MSVDYTFNRDIADEDEDKPQGSYTGRDACIVVIDASQSMFTAFEENDETTCLFTKCLSVIERLLLNKIINSHKDLFGVILYNTQHTPDPVDDMAMETPLVVPKNCAILVPMKQTEATTIKFIKNLKNSADFMDFDNKFGHSPDGKIADVLWLISTMFATCGKQIRKPQVMWFTNDDLPANHQEGSNEHQNAFQKAKDLQQFSIDIQFYPLKTDFNGDLFYKELICQLLEVDLDEYQFPDTQLNERTLLQRMFRRSYDRRALSYLTVEISDKAKFGVGIYNFVRKAVVPKQIKCTRDKNMPIVAKRSYKSAYIPESNDDDVVENMEAELDFKEKLEPSKTVKYQQVGGEKINFTILEAYEIKQVMDPKIKLLGFKPKSVLSDHNFIKASYFVYPSDTRVKNSSVFFRALWERCLADDKVAICIFTMKLKSFPRLVALVPQEQTAGPNGEILRFDGFRLQFIPFAGDIRDLSEVFVAAPEVDSDISAAMKKVVGKLQINYEASMFENPVVTRIYKKIEEEVFGDEPDEELSKDTTLPNVDAQDGRIGEFVDSLDQLLEGLDELAVTKRKASGEGAAAKRTKVSEEDVDCDLILKMCQEGNASKLTVPKLKAYLELKNVHGLSKLNKSQLVELVLKNV